jgi:hypothetical protein
LAAKWRNAFRPQRHPVSFAALKGIVWTEIRLQFDSRLCHFYLGKSSEHTVTRMILMHRSTTNHQEKGINNEESITFFEMVDVCISCYAYKGSLGSRSSDKIESAGKLNADRRQSPELVWTIPK